MLTVVAQVAMLAGPAALGGPPALVVPAALVEQEQREAPRTPVALTGVRSEDGLLIDDGGRSVVLRGINVVDKSGWTGSLSDPMIDGDVARQFAAMGFNHIRFGTTWASIEHDRGTYDDAYIDQLIAQLDTLDRYGIRAVIDMHQDVWSAGLGFDGAPAWADPQCNQVPNLRISDVTGNWFTQYASPAVNIAWANFWNDGYGALDPHCTGPVQTAFVAMWGHLASRLADHPAVIGYDLLNEPWPSAPPGIFEQVYLMPMYERVTAAIREHDQDTPIFFGAPIYSPAAPTVAFSPPDPNAVFAPHIYTETMFSGGAVSTEGRSDEVVILKDRDDADRMGVPMWVGEWGALHDVRYIEQLYGLFDRYALGATFWADLQYPGARLTEHHEDPHVRPYPEAYPGEASWSYDPEANRFEMTVAVGEGSHDVQIVVPRRLGLTTSDPGVEFVRLGPGGPPCQSTGAQPAHAGWGACRAIWHLEGPGTFELILE